MDRLRWLTSGGIFIFLTFLKLAVPGAAAQLRDGIDIYINRDCDYTAAFAYASELRSRFFPAESTVAPASEASAESDYTFSSGEIIRLHRELEPSLIPLQSREILPEAALIPDDIYFDEALSEQSEAADTPEEAAVPDCVQAFLDSQSDFADYALPANVDYSYTELPFSYTPPVSGLLSDGFGFRMHPILSEVRFHYGTDAAANLGDSVYAFSDGYVSFAGENDSYGKYIIISHSDGWQTLYAHCSSLYVSSGDHAELGQLIALVGSSGLATGPHLHFELTQNGYYYNPEYYVNYA